MLAGYDYALPESAIAQFPAQPRDSSRLLVLDRKTGSLTDAGFRDVGRFLAPGDLLVLNDTRVIAARLIGRRSPGGGRTELLLVRPIDGRRWEAMLGGRARAGGRVVLADGWAARLVKPLSGSVWEIEFEDSANLAERIDSIGHMPLPPYIRRPDDARDRDWYQTVYARNPGAVAAPTAGLHFTQRLLDELEDGGIEITRITLHVGPGTFRPVSEDDVIAGRLHAEQYAVPPAAADAIARARARHARVVAVGTTTARGLESRADDSRGVRAGDGETSLFIRPPYSPRVVDALITNFHLPRTSLLMLVAVFAGRERLLGAYQEALARGYRFYSYGDAMLLI